MDIQSGIQKAVEPLPTSLPSSPQQSGAHQQSEPEDSQAEQSARPTADNHSKDTQPAAGHRDDKKYFSVESIDGTMFHEAIRRLLLTERRGCQEKHFHIQGYRWRDREVRHKVAAACTRQRRTQEGEDRTQQGKGR